MRSMTQYLKTTFFMMVAWFVAIPVCMAMESAEVSFWKGYEKACHGNLSCLVRVVQEAPLQARLRGWKDANALVQVLKDVGRFRELGLSDEEGEILVRTVLEAADSKGLQSVDETTPGESPAMQWAPPTEPSFPYRAPAEFEPIQAVLLRWPFDWTKVASAWEDMIGIFAEAGVRAAVWVNTPRQRDEALKRLQARGIPTDHVRWVVEPTDTVWIRDYGPQVIRSLESSEWGVVDFHYYPGRRKDDNTPLVVAWGLQVPLVDRQKTEVVYTEGGNLNHDGLGCVVYSQRTYSNNPGVAPQEIDRRILTAFQAVKSLVPRDPRLDGTGHVDMFMKIVGSDKVLVGRYAPDQVDYDVLEECAALFSQETNGAGQPWQVVRIVQPDVYYTQFVVPVVRTYTNSLIVNNVVIVPVYGIPEDEQALAVYREVFPDKKIVPLNAEAIIPSGGAWHCVTMEMATP